MDKNESICNCLDFGLAIMPVRYTVVPTYINRPTPSWANLSSVCSVTLDEKYQYHVRILRQGFVYIYLPHLTQWKVYSVAEDGSIWKQADEVMAEPLSASPKCVHISKEPEKSSFFCIPDAKLCAEAYVAFSEFKWSQHTLLRHAQNPAARMQKIAPSSWSGAAESAVVANEQTISQILDYDPDFDQSLLPFDNQDLVKTDVDREPKEDDSKFYYQTKLSQGKEGGYVFESSVIDRNTTCSPWIEGKQNQSKYLASVMNRYSEGSKPMILALDDSIGIALELNGYYNELYGYIHQYRQEREFEFHAKSLFEQAKQMIVYKEIADDFRYPVEEHYYINQVIQQGEIKYQEELPIFNTYNQLSALIYANLYGQPNCSGYVGEFYTFPLGESEISHFDARDIYTIELERYRSMGQKSASSTLKRLEHFNHFTEQDKLGASNYLENHYQLVMSEYEESKDVYKKKQKKNIESQFAKYNKLIESKSFDKQYDLLLFCISTLAENRAQQLVDWLKNSHFNQSSADLDGNTYIKITDNRLKNVKAIVEQDIQQALANEEITEADKTAADKINLDGMSYAEVVARSIAGLELTEVGQKQLDEWRNFDNVFVSKQESKGLIWRAVTYADEKLLTKVQNIVRKIKESKQSSTVSEQSESTFEAIFNKLHLDLLALQYKKAQDYANAINELHTAMDKAANRGVVLRTEFGPVKTFALKAHHKFILSHFDSLFNKTGLDHRVDKLSTFLTKTLILTLAGIKKVASFAYLKIEHAFFMELLNTYKGPSAQSTWGRRKVINAARDKMNSAMERLDKSMDAQVEKANNTWNKQRAAGDIPHTAKSNPDADANFKARGSAMKNVRLALIVAMFEVYSWHMTMKQKPELEEDEFINTQRLTAHFALSAGLAELLAASIQVYKGGRSVAFGYAKIFSGTLGAFVGLLSATHSFEQMNEESKKGNYGVALSYFLSGMLFVGSSFLTVIASITYHIPWAKRLLRTKIIGRALSSLVKRAAVSAMARVIALRLVSMSWSGVLAIAAIAIEIIIYLVKDNPLEEWCKYSALGIEKNHKNAYEDIGAQQKAFNEKMSEMFGTRKEQEVDINSNEENENTDTISYIDVLALIEQDLQNRGVNYA